MDYSDTNNLIDNENQDVESPAQNHNSQSNPATTPVTYTSQLAALFIIVNVTIGAGLLAMPFAMQTSGIMTSMIIQVIFLVAIIVTCIMCTELTVKTETDSYHRVVEAHCHPIFYKITQAAILMIVFGAVVAYLVIIGDQSDRVLATLYGHDFCYTFYLNRRFIMTMAMFCVIMPLCCAKTVDFLKYGSFLGVVSVAFIMYVVISKFRAADKIAKDVDFWPENWSQIGSILPVFCLSYQCHLSWVPTVGSMRKEEKRTTYITITVAMIISAIVYSIVGVLAVLTFGKAIQKDLTESYSGNDWAVLTTIGIVAVKCMVTLPSAFLPARLSLIDVISNFSPKFAQSSERTKRLSVTLGTLKVALLLALFVPDIMAAVNVLGAIAVIFIFNLPAMAYLHHIDENRLIKQSLEGNSSEKPIYTLKDKFKLACSYFFIIFGFILMIMVFYKSITNIINSEKAPEICYRVPKEIF